MKSRRVAIVGGGAAGLMLAAMLDPSMTVDLFEGSRLVGRKLLVAGNGGFNLTNDLDGTDLADKYDPPQFMATYLQRFGSADFRAWLLDIGVPTYVGSSGRIFPQRGIKPIQVLQALKYRLQKNEVCIHLSHRWTGQRKHSLHFVHEGNSLEFDYDTIVYALGGASWPKTGSDGRWLPILESYGVATAFFGPSNCGWHVTGHNLPSDKTWQPLKNIAVSIGSQYHRGELMVTDYGIEGSPLYLCQGAIREQYQANGSATIYVDLKPDLTRQQLLDRYHSRRHQSMSEYLRRTLRLTATAKALLRQQTSKETYTTLELLVDAIKQLPIDLSQPRPLAEAISSMGGVTLDAVDADLQLRALPDTYVIGEMLDWDCPTGGYLLQGCASMAAYLAEHLR